MAAKAKLPRGMSASSEEPQLRRLLDVGRSLMTELDLGVVLDRVLADRPRDHRGALCGARDPERAALRARPVPDLRRGRGDAPRDRRPAARSRRARRADRASRSRCACADVGRHPTSYGFPAGHPSMHSFLGVPIMIRGQAWGNLYLTEKQDGGEFTERDEEAAMILADWAAIAIDNARLYETSERRREEAEKAIRGLEATRDVAVAIGGEIALEHVLELIVKRGRALVDARSLVIMLRDGKELVVRASAGHAEAMRGVRLPIAELDLRAGAGARPPRADHRRRDAPADRAERVRRGRLRRPRCWCRCSTAGRRSGCWRRSIAARRAASSARRTSSCCERSPPAPRPPWRWLRACRPTGCAARSPPPTPSAGAGRASCTTRRCRASAVCACCSPPRSAAMIWTARRLRCARPSSTSSTRSPTCARSSPSCAPPRWTSWACAPRSRRCSIATANRVRSRSTASCSCPVAPREETRFSEDLETTVYRLVQEALTNVAKHARAEHVRVVVVRVRRRAPRRGPGRRRRLRSGRIE